MHDHPDTRDTGADGATDLRQLLAGIDPLLDPGTWTFCTVPRDAAVPSDCVATFDEQEGRTLVLPVESARRAGLQAAGEWARITLRIHSSLEAVGFIAAIATALARVGISANVMSGYYHDHVFVQSAKRQAALDTIRQVAREAGSA